MHTRPRRLVPVIFAVALGIVLGACSPNISSDTPSVPPSSDVSAAPTDSTASAAPSDAPVTTQTDTAWGRIWDDLPPGFPVFPRAVIAEDATSEPVSGVFMVPDDASEIAAWMQAALETATYSTEALSGPFEDGSLVLDSVGEGDCRIQTVVTPMGGLTVIIVRYGAACPNR